MCFFRRNSSTSANLSIFTIGLTIVLLCSVLQPCLTWVLPPLTRGRPTRSSPTSPTSPRMVKTHCSYQRVDQSNILTLSVSPVSSDHTAQKMSKPFRYLLSVCVCVWAVTRGLTQPLNVKKQQALASCNTISTCMRQLGRGCGSLSESTFLVHIISKISTNVLCLLFDKHYVKLCATCFSLFLWSLVSLFLRLLDVALYF